MGELLKPHVMEREWWPEGKSTLANRIAWNMFRVFERRGVDETPLLLLRLDDVLSSFLATRRIEDSLPTVGSSHRERIKPTDDRVQLEEAGKARERLRKAMKEIEDSCAKAGTPIDQGVADMSKPMIKKAEGILEDALNFEANRKRRNGETDNE